MTFNAGATKCTIVVAAALFACGCANSGLDLSTSSITPVASASAATVKTDPVCVSLASQINSLKGDGTIERLEKAAEGKTAKVSVKREALQKQAELNKANAEFQTRCGPNIPKQAAQQPAATTPAATANAQAKAANAAPMTPAGSKTKTN
jgi:hypothetical protein